MISEDEGRHEAGEEDEWQNVNRKGRRGLSPTNYFSIIDVKNSKC